MNPRHPHFVSLLPPLLVFLYVFGVFAPSIGYPLLDYDDLIFITRNNLVLNGLSLRSVGDAFTTLNGDTAMYSPLLWISWMVDVSLFGATSSNPWPFHFGNVLLHAFNAVLLYFILRRIASSPRPLVSRHSSLVAPIILALLWACHPLRAESVAWATERKDTLSTFFAFLSILFYLYAWRNGHPARDGKMKTASIPDNPKPEILFFVFSFFFFLLGLLVKPMLVTLPFLFLLFDVFPLRRLSLDRAFSPRIALRLLCEKKPFFLLSAIASVLSVLTQTKAIQHEHSFLSRLALVPLHYAFYLIKTFIPVRLTPFYHPIVFSWSGLVPFALLFTALFVSACRFRATRPAWSLGILAFFGLFVPVIGFFHVGIHHIADRYSYLPAIGLSIAALPFLSAPSRALRIAATAIAALVLVALFPLTSAALRIWSSKDAFYDRAEAIFPDHPFVVSYRARQLITDHGDFAAAEPLLDAALADYGDNDTLRVLKAVCLDERLGPGAAFDYFTSFPASDCSAFELREAAQYALRAGKPENVLAIVDALIPTLPQSDALIQDLLYIRLVAALAANDPADFARTASAIPALAGKNLPPFSAVGPHYINQWSHLHRRDAWTYFKTIADNPTTPPLDLNNLAWVLATAPGWNPAPPEEILAMARRAAEAAPGHPVVLDTLAAALANASDFPSAVETARQALAIAAPDPDLSATIQSHLDCYLQYRPFRSDI